MSIDESGPTGAALHRGVFRLGDKVQLTDPRGHLYTITLAEGATFHTHRGWFAHAELIGSSEGVVVRTSAGVEYLALRPLLADYVVSMPRGAAVVYPKDAAQIVGMADLFPGARVVEAGVGSGALSTYLLRAVGDQGSVHSVERRADFAEVARGNVEEWFGGPHPAWRVTVGDVEDVLNAEPPGSVDRVVLDMLAPWENVVAAGDALVPGGVLCCYVATTPQLGRTMETLRAHGGFTEPVGREYTSREWHAEGLSIRPGHGTSGHTGFLIFTRRLAPGMVAPIRRRRPAPGAYGPDYTGQRPAGVDIESGDA